ncbi:DUF397 domain-containing protein [Streptomyces vastus]|uniref:DUF397 domain-containing protein n=1 Tax=Streptomyces vastus TaxID=285451 RepID=UPI0031E496CC
MTGAWFFWRKSSYSGAGESNCCEVALLCMEVRVRDSHRRDGDELTFTPETWRAAKRSGPTTTWCSTTSPPPRRARWVTRTAARWSSRGADPSVTSTPRLSSAGYQPPAGCKLR